MIVKSLVAAIAVSTASLLPSAASAAELSAPEGEVILTITGNIAHTNEGDTAQFDRAMLEALDPKTIETSTIWTEGEQTFTGVSLARLMEIVGAEGAVLDATAINDYAVAIPKDDWVADGPIVAYLHNNAPMSVRDKGPLWVVYPYDSNPAYQSEVSYSRSIWQLDRIVVGE